MIYFLSGFWFRLIIRIFVDKFLYEIVIDLFLIFSEVFEVCFYLKIKEFYW